MKPEQLVCIKVFRNDFAKHFLCKISAWDSRLVEYRFKIISVQCGQSPTKHRGHYTLEKIVCGLIWRWMFFVSFIYPRQATDELKTLQFSIRICIGTAEVWGGTIILQPHRTMDNDVDQHMPNGYCLKENKTPPALLTHGFHDLMISATEKNYTTSPKQLEP